MGYSDRNVEIEDGSGLHRRACDGPGLVELIAVLPFTFFKQTLALPDPRPLGTGFSGVIRRFQ